MIPFNKRDATNAIMTTDDSSSDRHVGRWIGVIPFVLWIILWELLSIANIQALRYVVPSLPAVVEALWTDIASGEIVVHFQTTIVEILSGFGIAAVSGLVIGTAIALSPLLDRLMYPTIVFFQSMPKIALAPLWLIVFGFGIGSKIALSAMVAFFPMLISVIIGMKAMRREEAELMRSLRSTPAQTFWKVRVPRALPAIFGGIQIAAVFALTGAVVAEFVGAEAGLGYLIDFRSSRLDLPGVFSPLIVLAVVGLLLTFGTKAIANTLIKWEGE